MNNEKIIKLPKQVEAITEQLESNVQEVNTLKTNKVDKVVGKGLSTNDYDNTEKSEVAKVKNKADVSYVNDKVATLSSATPKFVNSISEMIDNTKNYVLLNDSNCYIYTYNGTSFIQTNVKYQATDTTFVKEVLGIKVISRNLQISDGINYDIDVVKDKKYCLKVEGYEGSLLQKVDVYYNVNNSYTMIKSLNIGEEFILTATQNANGFRFYAIINGTETVGKTLSVYATSLTDNKSIYPRTVLNEDSVSKLNIDVPILKTAIGDKNYSLNLTNNASLDIKYDIKSGNKYYFKLDSYNGANFSRADVYLLDSTGKATNIGSRKIGEEFTFTATGNFATIRFFVVLSQAESSSKTFTVKFNDLSDGTIISRLITNELGLKNGVDSYNILVLGDSFSEQGMWTSALKKIININDMVNLGVSNATLKDRYTDRVAYPYTSRPKNSQNTGNLNTFACQIEKLKRLMSGTDLDSGESKIYDTQDKYPTVILIEGGTNDGLDSSDKVDNYTIQLYEKKTNVYTKAYNNTPQLGTACVKTDINTIDRTTFVGALRYLYEQLHALFPKALIYVITPSGLSYGDGGHLNYLDKGNQIKKASALLSIPIIDWGVNGRLNYLDNVIQGDGTQSNPYVITGAGQYSTDCLHPNADGGYLLARTVALGIKNS